MKKTMVRRGRDDFEALMLCNAMEENGGTVHSIVFIPRDERINVARFGEPGSAPGWHVFGVVEESDFGKVDEAFNRLMAR